MLAGVRVPLDIASSSSCTPTDVSESGRQYWVEEVLKLEIRG